MANYSTPKSENPGRPATSWLINMKRLIGRKPALTVLLACFTVRIVYSVLVWTPIMKSPDDSMSKMYVRSAILVASGLGHTQALPGSPASKEVERLREDASSWGVRLTTAIADTLDREGLYPETLHPPGWPLMAAISHRLTGMPIWFVMQGWATIIDVVSCFLLYLLTLRIFGKERIALIAASIYALFPPIAYEVVSLRPMSFMPFVTILTCLVFVHALSHPRSLFRWLWFSLAGVVVGIGAYFRSDILLLGPFLALSLVIIEKRLWLPILVSGHVLVISLVVLIPWALHTKTEIGKTVFTSTALGINLVNGLGEYPNPWGLGGSDSDRAEEARDAGLPHSFHHEADPYFRAIFMRSVREHPGALVLTIVRRALQQPIATPYDWGFRVEKKRGGLTELRRQGKLIENAAYIIKTYWSRVLSMVLSFAGLACLVATVFYERSQNPKVWLLLAVPLYFTASHILIHMEPRYLLPGVFTSMIGIAYIATKPWRSKKSG